MKTEALFIEYVLCILKNTADDITSKANIPQKTNLLPPSALCHLATHDYRPLFLNFAHRKKELNNEDSMA